MSLPENEKSDAIRHLEKALSDTHFDKEEAFALLRETDFIPERIVDRHISRIRKLQVQLEIQHSKTKRSMTDLMQIAMEQLEKFRGKFHREPKDLLKQLYQGELAFHHRKLEQLSDADAVEMLEEAQLLKLIKELEKHNNG